MTKKTPKVFISYSHDTAEHKQWVLDLATRLMNSSIDVILDAWEIGPGGNLAAFMETKLEESDRVIMVCTDEYVKKANEGTGGVGFEKMFISSALMENTTDNKFIPIIRQHGTRNTPRILKSNLYIDFSNDSEFETVIDDLMREILQESLFKKPPLGNNPYTTAVEKPAEKTHDLQMEIIRLLVQVYEENTKALSDSEIIEAFGISRIIYEMHKAELVTDGYCESINVNRQRLIGLESGIKITQKTKDYAIQQKWVE